MSDITRNDLRKYRPGTPWQDWEVTDAEFDQIARDTGYLHVDDLYDRAEALRALLTDPCDECDGTGCACVAVPIRERERTDEVCCQRCDGRGWTLKDGVTIRTEPHVIDGWREFLSIPADWLEGDDEAV